jgi:hypothetical protein
MISALQDRLAVIIRSKLKKCASIPDVRPSPPPEFYHIGPLIEERGSEKTQCVPSGPTIPFRLSGLCKAVRVAELVSGF